MPSMYLPMCATMCVQIHSLLHFFGHNKILKSAAINDAIPDALLNRHRAMLMNSETISTPHGGKHQVQRPVEGAQTEGGGRCLWAQTLPWPESAVWAVPPGTAAALLLHFVLSACVTCFSI